MASMAGYGPTVPQRTSRPRPIFTLTSPRYSTSYDGVSQEKNRTGDFDDGMEPAVSVEPWEPSQDATRTDYVPWYLQAQQPPMERQGDSFPARERLPELPEYPPDLLQPLLEHVSVELGIDDLTLLDLRSLDPPPALGANLLMIVGTARSEKHLHISADKLCRWLRTAYKLTPYADGLLGRNELKIKMRRKAKRSRLLSAVGTKTTAETDIDDGIRTGWVCVNVGSVEGGELPEQTPANPREEDVVGFGTRTQGSNIVVQMMTEEKRGEIDLETLWTSGV